MPPSRQQFSRRVRYTTRRTRSDTASKAAGDNQDGVSSSPPPASDVVDLTLSSDDEDGGNTPPRTAAAIAASSRKRAADTSAGQPASKRIRVKAEAARRHPSRTASASSSTPPRPVSVPSSQASSATVSASAPASVSSVSATDDDIEIIEIDSKPSARDLAGQIDDGDAVEIIDAVQPSMVPTAASMPVTQQASANAEEDIAVMGTVNQLNLPHMRQHCTQFPFKLWPSVRASTFLGMDARNQNMKHCDLCYCYVCDGLVKDCKTWMTEHRGSPAQNHCCASDKIRFWVRMRAARGKAKSDQAGTAAGATARAGPGTEAGTTTTQPTTPHTNFAEATVGQAPTREDIYGQDPEEEEDSEEDSDDDSEAGHFPGLFRLATARTMGELNRLLIQSLRIPAHRAVEGPPQHQSLYPPDSKVAAGNPTLTLCRKCGWYSRISKNTDPATHWCLKCGRVAHSQSLKRKPETVTYAPLGSDLFMGTQKIPFQIVAKDPRQMQAFKESWEKADTSSPQWTYNEAEMKSDMFNQRIGKLTSAPTLLRNLSVLEPAKIPKDGEMPSQHAPFRTASSKVEAKNTEAIVVENQSHVTLLRVLSQYAGFGKPRKDKRGKVIRQSVVNGDIKAQWDSENDRGMIRVRVYISQAGWTMPNALTVFPFLLGAWTNMFPLNLVDLTEHREAEADAYYVRRANLVPPFEENMSQQKRAKLREDLRTTIEAHNENASQAAQRISLLSGTGKRSVGGMVDCGTDLPSGLLRYWKCDRALLGRDGTSWTDVHNGAIFGHRSLQVEYHPATTPNADWLVTTEDGAIARYMDSSYAGHFGGDVSKVLHHVENIGHEGVDHVDGLRVELLEFQRQTVKWALERERVEGGVQRFSWLKVPLVNNPGEDLYYNPILNTLRRGPPAVVRGGFIAEEMGLGKTVMSLALILLNQAPQLPQPASKTSSLKKKRSPTEPKPDYDWDLKALTAAMPINAPKRGSIISHGTLVICPVSLVGQWIEEAKSKLENPGLVYPYHGGNRKRVASVLARNAIVVTTYQVIASDATYHAARAGPNYCPPLEQICWWRIIVDEGHALRQGDTSRSRAITNLVANHRWLVSGTPINTNLKDLNNQLKFLGFEKVDAVMRKALGLDERGRRKDYGSTSFGDLMFLLRPIMMRHTQKQKYIGTDTTLMSLPPKTERIVKVKFSRDERKEYDMLDAAAATFYATFRRAHYATLSSHYLKLVQSLMPMRVACAGGKYPIKTTADDDTEDVDGRRRSAMPKVKELSKFVFTRKFQVLLKELVRIRDTDATSKSLVFSQFTSTMSWLKEALPKHGFQFRTLSGHMTMRKRAEALRDFQNDPPTTVFLLTIRSGAVGINLTQANRVFFMEPSFNPALERQAVGRVHRLGQKRSVEIIKLVVENSVEERIIKVVEKKFGKMTEDGLVDATAPASPGARNNRASASNSSSSDTAASPPAAAAAATPVKSEAAVKAERARSRGMRDGDDDGDDNDDPDSSNGLSEEAQAMKNAIVGNVASEKTKMYAEEFDMLFGHEGGADDDDAELIVAEHGMGDNDGDDDSDSDDGSNNGSDAEQGGRRRARLRL